MFAFGITRGVSGTGMVQAALLEFAAAVAGARLVTAGFWGVHLCIFVHVGGVWDGDLWGFGKRHGGLAEDGERGFEAHGGGGFRVGEDLADGLERDIGEGFGLFADEEGAVVLRFGERGAEGGRDAKPVGDGVAVNSGCVGGSGKGDARGERGNDLVLDGAEW